MNGGVERLRAWVEPRVTVLQAVLLFAVGTFILTSGLPAIASTGPTSCRQGIRSGC